MAEPTCDEINEYLSRKFDGWVPLHECPYALTCMGPAGHEPPTSYCGPSADPILTLIERNDYVCEITRFAPRGYLQKKLNVCIRDPITRVLYFQDGDEFSETVARAVYARVKANDGNVSSAGGR